MALEKVLNTITSSGLYQAAGKKFNKLCSKIGPSIENTIDKHPKLDKFIKAYEPTGANNAFMGMTTLMVGTVIIPRVLTAKKRNPNNKEATYDEIKEILFRDVQTVLIILFSLKAMNSLVAGLSTKLKGLPMTNKPYQKLFESNTKGLKGIVEKTGEFIHSPIDKVKKIGKNVIDTLHPTGGVITLTNEEFVSKYSNYQSIDEISKLLNEIQNNGGDSKKVFNKVMDEIIKKQENLINLRKGMQTAVLNSGEKENAELAQWLEMAQENLSALNKLKEAGPKGLNDTNLVNSCAEEYLKEFFKDPNNSLVKDSLRLNGVLRSIALLIEMTYLGFGLPALNERRLEKKYLKNGGKNPANNTQDNTSSNELLNKNIKAQEIKLFHNFLK